MEDSDRLLVIGVRSSDEDPRPGARQRECHARIMARFAAEVAGAKVLEGPQCVVVLMGPEPGDRAEVHDKVWRRVTGQGRTTDAEMDAQVAKMAELYRSSGCRGMGWRALAEEIKHNYTAVDVFDASDLFKEGKDERGGARGRGAGDGRRRGGARGTRGGARGTRGGADGRRAAGGEARTQGEEGEGGVRQEGARPRRDARGGGHGVPARGGPGEAHRGGGQVHARPLRHGRGADGVPRGPSGDVRREGVEDLQGERREDRRRVRDGDVQGEPALQAPPRRARGGIQAEAMAGGSPAPDVFGGEDGSDKRDDKKTGGILPGAPFNLGFKSGDTPGRAVDEAEKKAGDRTFLGNALDEAKKKTEGVFVNTADAVRRFKNGLTGRKQDGNEEGETPDTPGLPGGDGTSDLFDTSDAGDSQDAGGKNLFDTPLDGTPKPDGMPPVGDNQDAVGEENPDGTPPAGGENPDGTPPAGGEDASQEPPRAQTVDDVLGDEKEAKMDLMAGFVADQLLSLGGNIADRAFDGINRLTRAALSGNIGDGARVLLGAVSSAGDVKDSMEASAKRHGVDITNDDGTLQGTFRGTLYLGDVRDAKAGALQAQRDLSEIISGMDVPGGDIANMTLDQCTEFKEELRRRAVGLSESHDSLSADIDATDKEMKATLNPMRRAELARKREDLMGRRRRVDAQVKAYSKAAKELDDVNRGHKRYANEVHAEEARKQQEWGHLSHVSNLAQRELEEDEQRRYLDNLDRPRRLLEDNGIRNVQVNGDKVVVKPSQRKAALGMWRNRMTELNVEKDALEGKEGTVADAERLREIEQEMHELEPYITANTEFDETVKDAFPKGTYSTGTWSFTRKQLTDPEKTDTETVLAALRHGWRTHDAYGYPTDFRELKDMYEVFDERAKAMERAEYGMGTRDQREEYRRNAALRDQAYVGESYARFHDRMNTLDREFTVKGINVLRRKIGKEDISAEDWDKVRGEYDGVMERAREAVEAYGENPTAPATKRKNKAVEDLKKFNDTLMEEYGIRPSQTLMQTLKEDAGVGRGGRRRLDAGGWAAAVGEELARSVYGDLSDEERKSIAENISERAAAEGWTDAQYEKALGKAVKDARASRKRAEKAAEKAETEERNKAINDAIVTLNIPPEEQGKFTNTYIRNYNASKAKGDDPKKARELALKAASKAVSPKSGDRAPNPDEGAPKATPDGKGGYTVKCPWTATGKNGKEHPDGILTLGDDGAVCKDSPVKTFDSVDELDGYTASEFYGNGKSLIKNGKKDGYLRTHLFGTPGTVKGTSRKLLKDDGTITEWVDETFKGRDGLSDHVSNLYNQLLDDIGKNGKKGKRMPVNELCANVIAKYGRTEENGKPTASCRDAVELYNLCMIARHLERTEGEKDSGPMSWKDMLDRSPLLKNIEKQKAAFDEKFGGKNGLSGDEKKRILDWIYRVGDLQKRLGYLEKINECTSKQLKSALEGTAGNDVGIENFMARLEGKKKKSDEQNGGGGEKPEEQKKGGKKKTSGKHIEEIEKYLRDGIGLDDPAQYSSELDTLLSKYETKIKKAKGVENLLDDEEGVKNLLDDLADYMINHYNNNMSNEEEALIYLANTDKQGLYIDKYLNLKKKEKSDALKSKGRGEEKNTDASDADETVVGEGEDVDGTPPPGKKDVEETPAGKDDGTPMPERDKRFVANRLGLRSNDVTDGMVKTWNILEKKLYERYVENETGYTDIEIKKAKESKDGKAMKKWQEKQKEDVEDLINRNINDIANYVTSYIEACRDNGATEWATPAHALEVLAGAKPNVFDITKYETDKAGIDFDWDEIVKKEMDANSVTKSLPSAAPRTLFIRPLPKPDMRTGAGYTLRAKAK